MRALMLSLFAVLLLPLGPARAETPVYSEDMGIAIRGFDTEAYFTVGEPTRGMMQHAVMWKGVTWLFASAANQEMFEANPRAYAPVYGGYCAFAVANGYLMDSDPTNFEIIDGRLFLTNSHAIHDIWLMDVSGNVSIADRNWPRVLGY